MNSVRPPHRWAESDAEIPSAFRDWLAHERADAPSDEQLRDLAARVSATLNADPNVVPLSRSDPEAELELLRRARGQLANTPQRALEATDQHHAQFRNGVFAQEREAIAIEALVRLGKPARARQRAKAFHSRYPNSAYARRLETIAPLP
jgi:hypothetical protein